MESANLGPSGWAYRVVVEPNRVLVAGIDVISALLGRPSGSISLRGITGPIDVYAYDTDAGTVRVAIREMSNGCYLVACNDAEIIAINP